MVGVITLTYLTTYSVLFNLKENICLSWSRAVLFFMIGHIHVFIILAAKTCCIAFVFYGETFVYQNCGESDFICTSVHKCVSAAIYNLFLSPVISHLIENNGWNSWCMYYKKDCFFRRLIQDVLFFKTSIYDFKSTTVNNNIFPEERNFQIKIGIKHCSGSRD